MTMLPRMKISPMVSPSLTTGTIVTGLATIRPSCIGTRTPWRDFNLARSSPVWSSQSWFQAQTTQGP